MIYGSRKYGLVWRFGLDENRLVLWNGDRPDWLICSRFELEQLYRELRVSFGDEVDMWQLNWYLSCLLNPGSICRVDLGVEEEVKFSDL